jgi:hypothetical protein
MSILSGSDRAAPVCRREALALRATGMGAFYDDRVHVYHFVIGYPVPDPRLDE